MKRFRFWTIQKKDVLYEILANGIYQPDFAKSWYANQNEAFGEFYHNIQMIYQKVNQIDVPGVVFSFAYFVGVEDGVIYFDSFKSYQHFQEYIIQKADVIMSLWKHLAVEDACILELEYDVSKFNPLWIDINDYQALMPPVMEIGPYSGERIREIWLDFKEGSVPISPMPSDLIQAHLPYIKAENLVHVYPIFKLL